MIVLELKRLELFGRHGVLDEEKRDGANFLYDVRMEVGDGALSDRIEDAVDYREVAECVRKISDGRQFSLIEALAAAVADAILEGFQVERVRVRVRKPKPAGVPAAYSAATVERSTSS
jgi:dihydroneopterin aldolase